MGQDGDESGAVVGLRRVNEVGAVLGGVTGPDVLGVDIRVTAHVRSPVCGSNVKRGGRDDDERADNRAHSITGELLEACRDALRGEDVDVGDIEVNRSAVDSTGCVDRLLSEDRTVPAILVVRDTCGP